MIKKPFILSQAERKTTLKINMEEAK